MLHLKDQGTTSLQSHSMAVSNPGFCQPLNFGRKLIITARNEVVAKVMFLLVSVILLTGGLPQCMLGYHPPGSRPLRNRHPPGSRPPPEQTHPPGSRHPPPRKQTHGIRSMSSRYASYWNAFFLDKFLLKTTCMKMKGLGSRGQCMGNSRCSSAK